MAGLFDVDISEVTAIAAGFDKGPAVLKKNNAKAARQSGFIVEGNAKTEAPVGETGNLKGGIRAKPPRQSGTSTSVDVVSHASYSRPVHDGRKAVVRTAAQGPIVFDVKGKTIFTMKTKAVAANPYMDRGLKKSEAQIVRVFDQAAAMTMKELGL